MQKEEFEQVYTRYYKAVYAYLMTLCHDSDLAADLAQETFYKALRGLGRFEGNCPVNVWLCSIAKHALADHYRRHKREVPLPETPPTRPTRTRCLGKPWNSARGRWPCTGCCTPCRNPTGRCSGCGLTVN